MSDIIKSPLTAKAEVSSDGLTENTLLYGVLETSGSDGKSGRDRKIKLTTMGQFLFGVGDNRTLSQLKFTDDIYIVGDDTSKVKTKVNLGTLTRFIIGSYEEDYVFIDTDSITIHRSTEIGKLGERVQISLAQLKSEIRSSNHFKSLLVGVEPGTSTLADNFSVDEGGNVKTIGNIPIAFLNENINDYQDLILSDFYYPASYYS